MRRTPSLVLIDTAVKIACSLIGRVVSRSQVPEAMYAARM